MGKMNRVTISVPHGTDLNFRKKAAIKFAFKRGWYGRAVQEAMQLWINIQSASEDGISEENKEYLWKSFQEHMKIESDDPEEILDCIAEFFTSEVKVAEKIEYEMNDNEVTVKKEGSLGPFVSQLVTKKGDCIIFNCPVKIIMDAALKDLTGKKYAVRSEVHTLFSPKAIKESNI
ncbi:MAG: hypothetical protein ACC614_09390 [Methanobacterium formicicum]|uniref:hypothetical protein n=1 Tax=Methanobacterium formicicum TaxID=2162 RepID=UPI003530EF5D